MTIEQLFYPRSSLALAVYLIRYTDRQCIRPTLFPVLILPFKSTANNKTGIMTSTIFTLPPTRQSSSGSPDSDTSPWSLRSEIESALKGTDELTIPGFGEEDKNWAFKRSVPTVVLYDEIGLR